MTPSPPFFSGPGPPARLCWSFFLFGGPSFQTTIPSLILLFLEVFSLTLGIGKTFSPLDHIPFVSVPFWPESLFLPFSVYSPSVGYDIFLLVGTLPPFLLAFLGFLPFYFLLSFFRALSPLIGAGFLFGDGCLTCGLLPAVVPSGVVFFFLVGAIVF